ncbi:hypothetical protein OH76DRAFT_651649 [Lentinus brumalis]|uniref:Uncharacterized protein n=1 Tax=Lentinus brumalis TaxID=2498619 RepID=A0A371D852_9APHY|nr:hypothetical protein OH76DRAFT_651649 [Polyporus brumalis]
MSFTPGEHIGAYAILRFCNHSDVNCESLAARRHLVSIMDMSQGGHGKPTTCRVRVLCRGRPESETGTSISAVPSRDAGFDGFVHCDWEEAWVELYPVTIYGGSFLKVSSCDQRLVFKKRRTCDGLSLPIAALNFNLSSRHAKDIAGDFQTFEEDFRLAQYRRQYARR